MATDTQPHLITDALQTKCKSCGGIVHYSPKDENLKCLYCGLISELDKSAAEQKGNDFKHWKKLADEESNDGLMEATEIKCRQCGATTTMPSNTSGAKCAFCSTPLILDEAHVKRFWQPEYLLPFKVTEKQSGENFRKWIGKKWFTPSKLKKYGVNTDSFKGVYLPFWTYDAKTHTLYVGERGEDRKVQSRNSKGELVERTVTDWHKTSGTVELDFKDIVIPASESLPPTITNRLTNWDMMNSVSYQKEFLSGFVTEIYKRDFRDGVDDAKKKMKSVITDTIKADIGGDDQRIKTQSTQYNDLMFKLLLLPVWISAFNFEGKLYQFVVNGRTGQVIGEYPKDKMKIILVVAAVIAVITALFMLMR